VSDNVLRIGAASLREIAAPVTDVRDPQVRQEAQQLVDALMAFRAQHGFGRAIAAPQIAIAKRMIAMALPGWPPVIVNPEITWHSAERMTLWDDCMCFPDMLVRVERHVSVSVQCMTLGGETLRMEQVSRDISELLQHEIDHLDGKLSFDRAVGTNPVVHRSVFDADAAAFGALVDYFPQTI
jgi:peptide deformylase